MSEIATDVFEERIDMILKAKMTRFLTIFKKTSYLPKDFKPEDIPGLREFLLNEYKFVEKYPLLYSRSIRLIKI